MSPRGESQTQSKTVLQRALAAPGPGRIRAAAGSGAERAGRAAWGGRGGQVVSSSYARSVLASRINQHSRDTSSSSAVASLAS